MGKTRKPKKINRKNRVNKVKTIKLVKHNNEVLKKIKENVSKN